MGAAGGGSSRVVVGRAGCLVRMLLLMEHPAVHIRRSPVLERGGSLNDEAGSIGGALGWRGGPGRWAPRNGLG